MEFDPKIVATCMNDCYKHYVLHMQDLLGPDGLFPNLNISSDKETINQRNLSSENLPIGNKMIISEAACKQRLNVVKQNGGKRNFDDRQTDSAEKLYIQPIGKIPKRFGKPNFNPSFDPQINSGEIVKKPLEKHEQHFLSYYNYQRISNLTKREQERYGSMLANIVINDKFTFADNKSVFLDQQQKMEEEYKLFNEDVKKIAFVEFDNRVKFCFPAAKNFFYEMAKGKAFITEETYPQFWLLKDVINLSNLSEKLNNLSSVLKYVRCLLELGKHTRIQTPDLKKKANVNRNDPWHVPLVYSAQFFQNKQNLLRDDALKQMIEKYGPQFAMSSSAVKRLLCCAALSNGPAWQIPINVRRVFVGGRSHVVLYFFKPLLSKRTNQIDLLRYFYKYAVKRDLIKHKLDLEKLKEVNALKKKASNKRSDDENDMFSATFQADDVEEFGGLGNSVKRLKQVDTGHAVVSPPSDTNSQNLIVNGIHPQISDTVAAPENQLKNTLLESASEIENIEDGTLHKSTLSDNALLIDNINGTTTSKSKLPDSTIFKQQKTFKRPSRHFKDDTGLLNPNQKIKEFHDEVTNDAASNDIPADEPLPLAVQAIYDLTERPLMSLDNAGYSNDSIETDSSSSNFVENPSEFEVPKGLEGKITYNLWSIDGLNIVVRAKIDGSWRESRGGHKDLNKQRLVSMLPTVEYFPEHGGHKLTDYERIFHWSTSLLKRTSVHLRPRIYYRNGEFLSVEPVDFIRLEKDVGHLKENAMSTMYYILSTLKEKLGSEEGWFLLCHEVNEPGLNLFKASDKRKGAKNLHLDINDEAERHNWDPLPEFEEFWSQIDPNCVLQWHRIQKRAPCTFNCRNEQWQPDLSLRNDRTHRRGSGRHGRGRGNRSRSRRRGRGFGQTSQQASDK